MLKLPTLILCSHVLITLCPACDYECVSFVPQNGWTDIYKTDKLVLRRIEPGSFVMTGNRIVTISKPFYIGIFEVTQKQYDHLMGGNLSHYRGAARPVECVSYDVLRGAIKGAGWPQTRDVDEKSVIGIIRSRLDCLGFDLPTEAQWEYAARAGATTALYNGMSRSDTNLIGLARFEGSLNDGVGNCSEHTTVGAYAPNNWGLYDTLGNVWEWCLDWHESQSDWNGVSVTDPLGPLSSENECRCVRGGGWRNGSYNCSLTYRGVRLPYSSPGGEFGFRLACNAEDLGLAEASNATYCIIDLRGQDNHMVQTQTDSYSFGPGCSSVFSYDGGIAHLVGVKGLAQKDFKKRSSDGTVVFTDECIVDVEKRTTTPIDNYWCEQFTDINMMVWTGWARYAGFTNEDDFAEYFIAHPEINDDKGIIEWTISQSPYRYGGQSDRPTMKWAWARTLDECNQFFPRMTNWLASANCLIYIQLDWVEPGTTNIIGSHAVTCCGYVVSSNEASSVQSVSHLFIIDSDNDKSTQTGGRNAPNTITGVPLYWDSKFNRLFLRFNQDVVGMIRFGCYQYTHDEVYQRKSYEGMNVMEEGEVPVTPDPVTPDPVTPDPVTPDPVTPNPVTPNPVTQDPVMPDPVVPAPVTPCYEVLNESYITASYAALKAVKLQGVVYNGCSVIGIVELKLGKVNTKKKNSKVSGSVTTLDGKKHAITAFNLAEIDGTSPKAVSLAVKDFGTMSVTIGGTQFAGSLGKYHVQSAAVGGNWSKGGTRVYVDGALGERALPVGTVAELLPDGEPVAAAGGKWKFAKAASVKWAKPKKGAAVPERYDAESGKGLVVDTSAGKTNLSAMKLAYTPKKGTFKGSFKVYALEGAGKATKLKKYTVNVSGVVVGGVGHGTATCKTPAASWPVTVK